MQIRMIWGQFKDVECTDACSSTTVDLALATTYSYLMFSKIMLTAASKK